MLKNEQNYKETENVQQPEQLTGQVNNQAQTVNDIVGEAVNQPTEEEKAKAERLDFLDGLRITTQTEVPPEQPVLSLDGVGFFALGDIHALKGKQKQGKSSVLKVMAAALLSGQTFRIKGELQDPLVLWCDTEQKPADVKLILSDIRQLTGLSEAFIDEHLLLFQLRKLTYETLYGDIALLIERYRPQLVILDGVVQFVQSFNDEVTSRQLIHDLMMLAGDFQCSIVNVLHENKAADDANMRGHLGTELSHAAGTVLSCTKSKQGTISVTCTDPRHGVVPTWSIRFDQNGRIVDADAEHRQELDRQKQLRKEASEAKRAQERQERIDMVHSIIREAGGSINCSDLVKQMEKKTGRDRTTIGRYLKAMLDEKTIYEANKIITATPQTSLDL